MSNIINQPIACSISNGQVAPMHDLNKDYRATLENVNPELWEDNDIYIDRLAEMPTHDENGIKLSSKERMDMFVNKYMQPYVDEFNDRQKRKDRKINEPYLDWHNRQRNPGRVYFEHVLQYGSKDEIGKAYYEAVQKSKDMSLDEEQRNKYATIAKDLRQEIMEQNHKWIKEMEAKGFVVMWATGHFDEPGGTPHYHVGGFWLGHGYKQGPSHHISASKALENAGYDRIKGIGQVKKGTEEYQGFQFDRFYDDFRKMQERDARALGYEIKDPQPKRGHENVHIFKAAQAQREEQALAIAANDEIIHKQQISKKVLSQQVNDLEEERSSLISEKISLQFDIKALNKDVDDIKKDIQDKLDLLSDLAHDEDVLIMDIEIKRKEFNEVVADVNKATTELDDLQQKQDAMQSQLATQLQEIENNNKTKEDIKKRAKQIVDEFHQQEAALQQQIDAKQIELDKACLKLQAVAETTEAFCVKQIKQAGGMFSKKEDLFTMDRHKRSEILQQNQLAKDIINSEAFTPKERQAMLAAEAAARAAERDFKKKEANLDDLVEERLQARLALLNRTEPQRIKNLEQKLSKEQKDKQFVCDKIKDYLLSEGLSIKDFERFAGFSLDKGTRTHSGRDDLDL